MITLKSVIDRLDDDIEQYLYSASYNGDDCIKLVFSTCNQLNELIDIIVYVHENDAVELAMSPFESKPTFLDKRILDLMNKLMAL